MNSVGIIGFGRFGKVLANILQKGFIIKVYDPRAMESFHGVSFTSFENVAKEQVIFICVPIRHFESVVKEIAPILSERTTIIDVCSVKQYPVQIMQACLQQQTGIIATHPLFGPDSFLTNNQLKIMMDKTRDLYDQFYFWSRYFKDQGIQVIEMSPKQHDMLAARTQGVTHFLGRMLKEFGITKTNIDTQGFRDLLDLMDQTCHDSWELFTDLQAYNPYTKKMVGDLINAANTLINKLQENEHVAAG